MAQQKSNTGNKPSFTVFKKAKAGARRVSGARVKKFKSEGKKRGPKEMDIRGAGNTQKCLPLCRCITCLIAKGNAENDRRMRQGHSFW